MSRKTPVATSRAAAVKPTASKSIRKPSAKTAAAAVGREKVASAVVGGYRVFATPTKPAHLSPRQIADALAALG